MAKCNNKLCVFCNIDKELCMTTPYIVDCHCITYRRRLEEKITATELMKQPYRANCKKDGGGKYKTNKITSVLR